MSQFSFPVVTDENIHPRIVTYLRGVDINVLDIKEQNWFGMSDAEILTRAYEQGRVVITHDSDFGRLAVLSDKPLIGILYLRPAEIQTSKTIEKLSNFLTTSLELQPPFIAVIQDKKVRIRNL